MTTRTFQLDGHSIEISNTDKLLFPDDGITKGDLAEYYCRIAEIALPHYRDRPLTMQRFPDGIGKKGFFHKNIPDHFPEWIDRVEVPKQDGTVCHVLANSAATLVYLADQGCITPHLAVARADDPNKPDRLVFDLDPSDGDFAKVQEVAKAIKGALEAHDLPSFVQTTGSRGLHIVLPLDRSAGFEELRGFMRAFAQSVADTMPNLATVEQRKAKRGDRVLIDTFRTAYGQTAVAPYAVRARAGAPVATPLRWDEALGADMQPQKYGLGNIFRRLAQIDDPWLEIDPAPLDGRQLARLRI